MKRKYFGVGLALVIAVVAYFLVKGRQHQDTVMEEKEDRIQVSAVAIGAEAQGSYDKVYSATIESMRNTVLKASVTGTITQLYAHLGMHVSAGQVLARVESPESAAFADSGLRSAEIKQSEVQLEQMKKVYQEAKRAYENDKTHANEVAKQVAKLDYESAQIALQSAIDGRIIKSPVAGVVSVLNIGKNENVSSGQEVITISQDNASKISFYVSQVDLKDIQIGKRISIASETNEQSFAGTISRIAPQADLSTGKFLVEAYPESKDIASLVPGTIGKVSVSGERKAGDGSMLIPLEALLVGQNTNTVFMLHEGDDHAKKTQVEVVRIHGGMAEIAIGNFHDTDRIVISNARMLNENDRVIFQESL